MATLHHTHCPLCVSSNIHPDMRVTDHSITGEQFELWRCAQCDFLFTQDPPVPAEAGSYYEGEAYISHSDSQKGLVNGLYHRARDYMLGRKHALVERVAPGNRLLDYGTGTGYFTHFMLRHGYDVKGIEIDEKARAYGREKFGIQVFGPKYLHKGLKENSLDAITLWHVLEHLYEPKDYLNRFADVLTSRGKLIIAVPNNDSPDAEAYGADWAAYDVPRHLWHFTPKTMGKMLGECGFRIAETRHMPMDPFYVSIMSDKYKNGGKGLIGGALNGLKSFATSIGQAERGSSVIYVCEKA